MERIPPKHQKLIDAMEYLTHVQSQQNALKFAKAPTPLLADLSARFKHLRETSDLHTANIPEGVIEPFKQSLLFIAPSSDGELLKAEASEYAEDRFNGEAEFARFAKWEVTLLKLHLLCIDAAASSLPDDVRAQEWSDMRQDAQAKLDQVELEWQATSAPGL